MSKCALVTAKNQDSVTAASLESAGQGGFKMPFMVPITEDFPSLTFLPPHFLLVFQALKTCPLDQPAAPRHKLQILGFNSSCEMAWRERFMSRSTLAVHDTGCRNWLGSSFCVSHAGKVCLPSGGCSWNRTSLTSLAFGGLRAPPYSVLI